MPLFDFVYPMLIGYYAGSSVTTGSTPQLGGVDLLYQNDLSPNVSTGALFLHQVASYHSASGLCSQLGEKLYTSTDESALSDIQDQLSYLVHDARVNSSTKLWAAWPGNATNLRMRGDSGRHTVVNSTVDILPVTVESGNLSITGYRDARSFRFLGIPFAAPPIGNLRFQPPQLYTGPANITATSFGSSCIQAPGNPFGVTSNTSEDCLFLNIYTPSIRKVGEGRLAVGVWIYGGAFTTGSSSLLSYDGGNMASRGGIVVVTSSGGLATRTLLRGNQGIEDQIAALKWVQQHISAFGGDPSRVTIFGESAGGQSVLALLSSIAASGLFSAAISQSPPSGRPWSTRDVYSKAITPTYARFNGCPNSTATAAEEKALVACLLKMPAQRFANSTIINGAASMYSSIMASQFEPTGRAFFFVEPFLPIGEGAIDDQLLYLLGNGTLPNKVPLMIGTMRDEGQFFVETFNATVAQPLPNNQTTYSDILNIFLPVPVVQVMLQSGQRSQTGAGYPPACLPGAAGGQKICHGEDLISTFGSYNVQGIPFASPEDRDFTAYVVDVWTSFIRTHKPDPDPSYLQSRGRSYQSTLKFVQETPFPPYDPTSSDQALQILDYPPRHSGLTDQNKCKVLDQIGYPYDAVNNAF